MNSFASGTTTSIVYVKAVTERFVPHLYSYTTQATFVSFTQYLKMSYHIYESTAQLYVNTDKVHN